MLVIITALILQPYFPLMGQNEYHVQRRPTFASTVWYDGGIALRSDLTGGIHPDCGNALQGDRQMIYLGL